MKRSTKVGLGAIGAVLVLAGGLGAAAVAGAGDGGSAVRATLIDPNGTERGKVKIRNTGDHSEIRVDIDSTADDVARDAFHGLHLHTNTDPANGEGCIADPDQPSSTWFVAVDGHWKSDGQTHGHHDGDLPSVYVSETGSGEVRFVMDKIDLDAVIGRAVIVHAGADNFGNVPVGDETNQYLANSEQALIATANTGNAGDRVLCGVLD